MIVVSSSAWTGREGGAPDFSVLRDWKRHRALMEQVLGVLDTLSRRCGVYVVALLLITLGLTVLEVADRLGAGWGEAAPTWVKVGLYAACFLGMTLTVVNADYEANMLERWGVFRPGRAMGELPAGHRQGGVTGRLAGRLPGRFGRKLERSVVAAALHPGRNEPVVPLAESLQRFALAAASTAGFAPGVIFLPDVLRSADHTVPAMGLLVWMAFAFTWMRQGFDVTSSDLDELLNPAVEA